MSPAGPAGSDGSRGDETLGGVLPAMPVEAPRRSASLTLRAEDVRVQRAASMEAANQSLADALRITYRLIQLLMLALIVLFLMSGFQQVNESERGIRVQMGKVVDSNLAPGFQFSLPYPLGEIVKVSTSQRRIVMTDSFFPVLTDDQEKTQRDRLGMTFYSLAPGRGGSLLTADGGIVHVRLGVDYHREDPAKYLQELNPDDEEKLVRAAVERATVQTVARLSIDEVLKRGGGLAAEGAAPGTPTDAGAAAGAETAPSSDTPNAPDEAVQNPGEQGDAASIATPADVSQPVGGAPAGPARQNDLESAIRREAQQVLDRLECGLQIDSVSLTEVTPPFAVLQDFIKVNNERSNAAKKRDDASKERTKRLNDAAGAGHEALLAVINEYEKALELNDSAKAEEWLETFNRIVEGEMPDGIEIGGKKYSTLVAGRAAAVISAAKSYAVNAVNQAATEATKFEGKLAQHDANPSVFLVTEWTEAYKRFYTTPTLTKFWIPAGAYLDLATNPDPRVQQEVDRAIREEEAKKNPGLQRGMQAGSGM